MEKSRKKTALLLSLLQLLSIPSFGQEPIFVIVDEAINDTLPGQSDKTGYGFRSSPVFGRKARSEDAFGTLPPGTLLRIQPAPSDDDGVKQYSATKNIALHVEVIGTSGDPIQLPSQKSGWIYLVNSKKRGLTGKLQAGFLQSLEDSRYRFSTRENLPPEYQNFYELRPQPDPRAPSLRDNWEEIFVETEVEVPIIYVLPEDGKKDPFKELKLSGANFKVLEEKASELENSDKFIKIEFTEDGKTSQAFVRRTEFNAFTRFNQYIDQSTQSPNACSPTSSPQKKISEMNISDAGLDLIKEFEGYRDHIYLCSGNCRTIGWGHNFDAIPGSEEAFWKKQGGAEKFKTLDSSQKEKIFTDLLKKDVEKFETRLETILGKDYLLTQNQFDALISFVFNLGPGSLSTKTQIGKALRNRNFSEVPKQILRWDKAGGIQLKGLTRRRKAEAKLWNGEK